MISRFDKDKNIAEISKLELENDVIELLHRFGRHAESFETTDELIDYTVNIIREWKKDLIDFYFKNEK